MKKLTTLLFSVLFVSLLVAFIISCGGVEQTFDSTADEFPESMVSNSNCQKPNMRIDVNLNKKFCGNEECTIPFAGYQWWTNYQYRPDPYWFYNIGQAWSPRGPWVDSEGLHLRVMKDNLGGGDSWCASEVVLVYQGETGQTLANVDYGTYLVAAKIKTANSFAELDRNVAFGLFTYDPSETGGPYNKARELDLAEISKWGAPPDKNVIDKRLLIGNAQFTLQDWQKLDNLHRYTIPAGVKEVTLVMYWPGPKKPVTFKQYNGIYKTIESLPSTPANSWTTSAQQNDYIPDDGCQRFHMNLWMGNYGEVDNKGTHPGPSNGQAQEVVVTNFVYKR